MKKYFIGIVPKGEAGALADEIKQDLKEVFGLKYALKSPSHVTLKMPFLFNEKNEGLLLKKLNSFFAQEKRFELQFKGFKTFGKRVIYIGVNYPSELLEIQGRLAQFCKSKLGQTLELSDTNFKPHMTIAFKDLKKSEFEKYLEFLKKYEMDYRSVISDISLLKKEQFRWETLDTCKLQ
ncbi:MAG: 2'-5' RNA ligase family protein [Cyclobacteriaceae bacterium]